MSSPPTEVGTVALLQCTSPLTRAGDVTKALRLLEAGYDSVFSLVRRRPGLIWRHTEDGECGGGERSGGMAGMGRGILSGVGEIWGGVCWMCLL